MAIPKASPVVALVLSEENKANAEQVMARAIEVGRSDTEGDYTTTGLCYMFLAAMGAWGADEQRRVMETIQ